MILRTLIFILFVGWLAYPIKPVNAAGPPQSMALTLGLCPGVTDAQISELTNKLGIPVQLRKFEKEGDLVQWFIKYGVLDLAIIPTAERSDIFAGNYHLLQEIPPGGNTRSYRLVARIDLPAGIRTSLNQALSRKPPEAAPTPPPTQAPPPPPAITAARPKSTTPATGTATETILLAVSLNTAKKGDHFFELTDTGTVLIAKDLLLALNLSPPTHWPTRTIKGREVFALSSLAPELRSEIDIEHGAIQLTAEPQLFTPQEFNLSDQKNDQQPLRPETPALLFNYRLLANYVDDFELQSFSAPMQLSASFGAAYGITSFNYREWKDEGDPEEWQRFGSSLIFDRPENYERMVIGDFTAANGLLGGSGSFGGASYRRVFAMDPYFKKYPQPMVSGAMNTPGRAELYVNDTRVQSKALDPGSFVFGNIPNTSGYGEVKVITTDALGRETETSQTYYVGMNLLKPGLHDFSYNLGWQRQDQEEELFSYEDLSFIGFHRVGLTPWLTGGVRAEFGSDLSNAALTSQLLLKEFGELDLILAGSSYDGKEDWATASAYQFRGRKFSFGTFIKHQGYDYNNLSLSAPIDRVHNEVNFNFGLSFGDLGSLSLGLNRKDYYLRADQKTGRLSYSKRLSNNLNLAITASKETDEGWREKDRTDNNEVLVGLTWLFDQDSSAYYGHSTRDNSTEQILTLQKNPPVGNGFSYNAKFGHLDLDREFSNDDKEDYGYGRLSYRGTHGIYEAEYAREFSEDHYLLSTTGAVSLIDKEVYLTKPVSDSLAVVKVGDVKDVAINFNNQEFTRTDEKGIGVVTDLQSYRDNVISIDDKDVPINYQLDETQMTVSPYPRSGGVVTFTAKKLQGFTGRVFLDNAKKHPAEYAKLTTNILGRSVESFIGKGGEFYLENLPPGETLLYISLKNISCNFKVNIPSIDETLINLGDFTCVAP